MSTRGSPLGMIPWHRLGCSMASPPSCSCTSFHYLTPFHCLTRAAHADHGARSLKHSGLRCAFQLGIWYWGFVENTLRCFLSILLLFYEYSCVYCAVLFINFDLLFVIFVDLFPLFVSFSPLFVDITLNFNHFSSIFPHFYSLFLHF